MLGDNAYDGGFDSEYQNAVFDNMYDDLLMNTPLFPAPGNHDYNNHIPFSPAPAYYNIFTLPSAGQYGGVPWFREVLFLGLQKCAFHFSRFIR
jgi:hypothetical protein